MDRVGVNLFDIGQIVNKPINNGSYEPCKHIWEKTIKRYGELKYRKCKKCGAIWLWR